MAPLLGYSNRSPRALMSEHTLDDIDGIGPETKKKLEGLGIQTVEALAFVTSNELEAVGIEKAGPKFIEKARDFLKVKSFVPASEILKTHRNIKMLKTGSSDLDDICKGGLETQTITEFVGPYGCGKSQIAFTALVLAQLPENQGGLNGRTLIVDTEQTFRPKRIWQIAEARGLDPQKTIDGITLASAYNSEHQMFIVNHADKVIKENGIRLLVVDSLMAHFRSEYLGRENLPERQGKLNEHLHKILRLARAFNLAAIITNQAIATPEGSFYGPQWVPAGGHVVAHASGLRVLLKKEQQNIRTATIGDSSWIEYGSHSFMISPRGIENVSEETKKKVKATAAH